MKMMRKIILGGCITVLSFLSFEGFAQQQGQYSQYMMNYFLVNPAVAGTEDFLDIRMGYRNQWAGLEGAPKNYYLTAHMPLNKIHDSHDKKFHRKVTEPYHVLGGMASGQTLGAIGTYTANLSYAFHLPLTLDWSMSGGVSAGMMQYSLNQSKLEFSDTKYDQAQGSYNKIKPNLNVGVWFYTSKFFGGLSSSQLFESQQGYSGKLQRHYYATAGYKFQLNKELGLVPSLLFKTVPGAAYQVDVNAKLRYLNLAWVGMSYRHHDAVVLLIGANIKDKFEIGYSYDVTTSALRTYSAGSHELMLALKFDTQAQIHSPSDFW
jgi:type IX secretion system PorP/SprF family membrane protein